jgi:hypothetical protein
MNAQYDLKLNLTALAVDGKLDLELFDNGICVAGWSEKIWGTSIRNALIEVGWTPPLKRSKAPPCWPFSV